MSPKGLLRAATAAARTEELTTGEFQAVIADPELEDQEKVTRLLLCSGRVYYDLQAAREKQEDNDWAGRIAIGRIEQLYPFPLESYRSLLALYPRLSELVWVQEEPQNMGAYRSIRHRLESNLSNSLKCSYAGRPWRASPAEGYPTFHVLEQARLIQAAFAKNLN